MHLGFVNAQVELSLRAVQGLLRNKVHRVAEVVFLCRKVDPCLTAEVLKLNFPLAQPFLKIFAILALNAFIAIGI